MHRRVLSFIRVVRCSFPDAAIIYTHGACYGFYQILKEVFPSAVAMMSSDKGHIVTLIDGKLYDINGVLTTNSGLHRDPDEVYKKLTKAEHEWWESVVAGQRVEHMIAKYNRRDN